MSTKAEKAAKVKILTERLKLHKDVTKAARVNMVKSGIIVDVINVVQARLAQGAGFTAVCPLDYLPAQLETRKMSRLVDPRVTQTIANSVLIPVVAKISIGHDIEAGVAIEAGANFIDESEFAIRNSATVYMDTKSSLSVPFICGVTSLADCLKRLKEGAKILRIKQPAAVRVDATVVKLNEIAADLAKYQDDTEREKWLKANGLDESDFASLKGATDLSCLPIYAYGSISTPRDVALMMAMKCSGVFVDNSVFASDNPRKRLRAMVQAVKCYDNMEEMIKLSMGTGEQLF
ncbi:Pyridoxal 5'-phosphate synthase subunit snz1 [Coemansia sp. RSA 2050]|nr:Pyridoxal 5'-phosphate synthase subunit snz1 [Coemansia sp. RSA 2050]KAJ2732625.1 Pyridoxal 5'-phosphate synthase subunit snz1 [Coemansia sp. BCRC 34962]